MNGLSAKLTAAGLGKHACAILDLARASVRVDARACRQDELKPGASRFGGDPDLPAGFEWPRYRNRPLSFLAQIELAAIPQVSQELPREGCLVFFYEVESMQWGFDPADRGCSHVAFFETRPDALHRTSPPHASPPVDIFRACALSFTPTVDLPDAWDYCFESIYSELSDAEHEAYGEVIASLHAETYHHLLGHAQLVQNDMRVECQLASSGINVGSGVRPDSDDVAQRNGAGDWEILFQIDTDEEGPGWMWGDVGRIYFWLRKQDFTARRFDNSWLVLQCC